MRWFGNNPIPSDYPNAEMPNFNMQTFVVFSVFIVIFVAYVLILPGVRKKRVITTFVVVLIMFVGASITASLYLPRWATGTQMIYTQFRAHSNERILAKIGVEIGLQKVNVTLKFERLLSSNDILPGIDMEKLYFNEGFDISGVSSMSEALRHALIQGLPYPMLSVLEYFSLNQDAFDWGRHYRVAGHYTNAAVWFGFACYILSIVLIFLLPHDAYKSIFATGCSLIVACLLYFLMSPCELRIAFTGESLERVDLTATFSFCFYLIIANGAICFFVGLGLGICEHLRWYTLSTFLDAALDEHVGRKWKRIPTNPRCHGVRVGIKRIEGIEIEDAKHKSDLSSDKTHSSGFASRTSTCQSSSTVSLSSQTSFETVHDEQELEQQNQRVRFSQDPCCSSDSR